MNSQDRDREVRKILFAIFQEMKPDDVMAASFFIRSKSNMNCSNKFELMHELENLSFFDVSKLNFDDFIELLSDIDRIDLAKKLESQVAKLQSKSIFLIFIFFASTVVFKFISATFFHHQIDGVWIFFLNNLFFFSFLSKNARKDMKKIY